MCSPPLELLLTCARNSFLHLVAHVCQPSCRIPCSPCNALPLHANQTPQAVPQNKKGHLIGHIKDIGHDPSKPDTRLYATNVAQPWHNDGPADLVCECDTRYLATRFAAAPVGCMLPAVCVLNSLQHPLPTRVPDPWCTPPPSAQRCCA